MERQEYLYFAIILSGVKVLPTETREGQHISVSPQLSLLLAPSRVFPPCLSPQPGLQASAPSAGHSVPPRPSPARTPGRRSRGAAGHRQSGRSLSPSRMRQSGTKGWAGSSRSSHHTVRFSLYSCYPLSYRQPAPVLLVL